MLRHALRRTMSTHATVGEKNIRKMVEQAVQEEREVTSELPRNHVYRQLYPWKSLNDFVQHLAEDCVVYNGEGLVVINKPYGVGKVEHQGNAPADYAATYSHQPSCPFTLLQAMQPLAEKLGLPSLQIIRSAEKHSSGLTLLGADPSVVKKIKKAVSHAKCQKMPYLGFLMVCQGCPTRTGEKEKLGLSMGPPPSLVLDPSMNQLRLKNLKLVHTEWELLAKNKDLGACLVQLQSSTPKAHLPRLFIVHRLALCVLGDTLHGSRIATLLGRPITLPDGPRAPMPLAIPLSQALRMPRGVAGQRRMPPMIHHHRFLLPRFLKDADLELQAPVPPHFAWTCKRLGLDLPLSSSNTAHEHH